MAFELNSWSGVSLVRGFLLVQLMTCLGAAQAQADTPVPYGERFIRKDQQWQDAAPNPLAQSPSPDAGADISLYERQVTMLEQQGGPYADALSEPLAGLARYYLDKGQLDKAQELYRRALHVVRINDGLYSQRQAPILRALLDSYRLVGDMQGLDDRYDYYFRLYGSGKPPYTALRLQATLEYLRWQREALRLELGDEKPRLLDLYELNEDLLDDVALDSGLDPAWRRQLTFSQLRNLYLIQQRYEPLVEATGYVPANQYFGATPQAEGLNDRRLDQIVRSIKAYGVTLLEELSLASTQASAAQRAEITLALGDWYQWNNETRLAAQRYAEVAGVLQEAGEDDRLLGWLGQPVELPDNGAFWQPPGLAEAQSRVLVFARYDVSPTGRASNIEASTAVEADAGKASSVRRLIARTRFRPRFMAGEAEPVLRLERQYELLDQ